MGKMKPWTFKELLFLKENYESMSNADLARSLGRSYASIVSCMRRQDLVRDVAYQYYIDGKLEMTGTIKEIAAHEGITTTSVYSWKKGHVKSKRIVKR